MTKSQFWTLNTVGGLCGLLIVGCLILSPLNNQLNQTLVQNQTQLNNAQQMQTTFQNLAVRIAQSAQTEPVLLNLLERHDLKVNLNQDGQTKQVP